MLFTALPLFRRWLTSQRPWRVLMAHTSGGASAWNKLMSSSAGLCLLFSLPLSVRAEQFKSLAGTWRFALDREDAGIRESWFNRGLSGVIKLPGSLPGQDVGDKVSLDTPWTGGIVDQSFFTEPEYANYRQPGNFKVPFWLQPEKYFKGAAWFQCDFEALSGWQEQRVVLVLERPHWETRVWLDGQLLGTNASLATPHEYDLGQLLPRRHTLTIRVDNRMIVDVGRDSHSVSDHTQGNWNGIVGQIGLRLTSRVWLDELQVYPHVQMSSVTVRGRIGNATGLPGAGTVRWRVVPATTGKGRSHNPGTWTKLPVSWNAQGTSFQGEISVPDSQLWDEFDQPLYDLQAAVDDPSHSATALTTRDNASSQERTDSSITTVRFGMREFGTEGTQFTINGRKTFLRGTLECSIFPKTGHPPTDLDSWRRLIRVAKSFGLNNLRFHSWCPPEAAFRAADELGIYFHIECSSWANASTTLGDGKPVDDWIYHEADRILRAYGNHPSFVMMLYGNEPGGKHYSEYLSKWVAHYRALDSRRLFSSGAGWPQIPENQFHVTPDPRIQGWGAGLKSRINGLPPETTTDYRSYITNRTVPVVSHEIGEWCVYPNFDEIKKYTGYLKPRNFEIFRDTLNAHHQGPMARSFLLASGKLQTLCYKEEIESALRTPGMGGFQLLDLHDFPGQGTALVGVLDPFWEEKGYVTAAQYHRFCGATVPLARLEKRVFTQDEIPAIELEVAHFGKAPLVQVQPILKLVDDSGKVRLSSQLEPQTIAVGNGLSLGRWQPHLDQLPAPARYRLVAGLASPSDRKTPIAENDWDVWVYPPMAKMAPLPKVSVLHELNESAWQSLRAGATMLWLLPPDQVAPDPKLGPIALGFSSIFWNTAWTKRQAPHTLGIVCNPKHPLFGKFPTDSHSNWQWWYLIHRAAPMLLEPLSVDVQPPIQVIDDWFTARRLGLFVEVKVGKGALAICSIDLEHNLDADPVARQFRQSLFAYLESSQFHPRVEASLEQLRALQRP